MAKSANSTPVPEIHRRTFLKALPFAGLAVAAPTPASPDERIEHAMAVIRDAIAEMNPDFKFDQRNDFQRIQRIVDGQTVDGDPYSHAVLIYGYDPRSGRQSARWHREYN